MKKILVALLLLACSAQAQRQKPPVEVKGDEKTCFAIGNVTAVTGTEKIVAASLGAVFKLRALTPQYNWLEISDVGCAAGTGFTLNVKITEISRLLTLDCSIMQGPALYYQKKWEVKSDSLTTDLDRMFTAIATLIAEKTFYPTQTRLTYMPGRVEGKLAEFDKVIDNTWIKLLGQENTISTSHGADADLIFESSFIAADTNTFRATVSLRDPVTKDAVYESVRQFEYLSLLSVLPQMFQEVSVFISSYSVIRNDIAHLKTPQRLVAFVTARQEDISNNIAITLIRRALMLDNQYVPALAKLGELYVRIANINTAITYLKRAVDQEPNNAEYTYWLAKAFLEAGEKEVALGYAQRSAKLQSSGKDITVNALTLLAAIELDDTNYDQAIEHLTQALEIDKKNEQALYAIADVLVKRYDSQSRVVSDSADLNEALQWLERGERWHPRMTRNIGHLLVYWGDRLANLLEKSSPDSIAIKNLAEKKYLRALNTGITDELRAYTCTSLAYLYCMYFLDINRSMQYSERALNLRPKDEWTYRFYAFLRKNEPKKYPRAKAAVNQAMALDPLNMNSRLILAEILMRTEKLDSAMLLYEYALGRMHDPDVLETYVAIACDLKRYERAKMRIDEFRNAATPEEKLLTEILLAYTEFREGYADRSLSRLKDVLEKNPRNQRSMELLDTLYEAGNKDAYKIMVKQLEENFHSDRIDDYYELFYYYGSEDAYQEILTLSEEGLKNFTDSASRAFIHQQRAEVFTRIAQREVVKNNEAQVTKNAALAIDECDRVEELFPQNTRALQIKQYILSDILFRHNEAFTIATLILTHPDTDLLDSANYLDAAFLVSNYRACYEMGSQLLQTDFRGISTEDKITELNVIFYTAAAAVAIGNRTEASSLFGKFSVLYRALPPKWETEWTYFGLQRHLKSKKDDFGAYSDFMLALIKALEAGDTVKGGILITDSENILRRMN